MNISEADAANIILHSAANRIRVLTKLGMDDNDQIVLNGTDLDNDEPRTIELGRAIKAGELLADKAHKALGAGIDARAWRKAIGREQ
jgi:hypothetical protein